VDAPGQRSRLDAITLWLGLAILVAGVGSVGARSAFQVAYQSSLTDSLRGARSNLQSFERALGGSLDDVRLRSSLVTAGAGIASALEPISRLPRLRGTYLEDTDELVQHTASVGRQELQELAVAVQEKSDLSQVAYRAERVLDELDVDGILSIEPEALAEAHQLWLQGSLAALSRADAEVQAWTAELVRWRGEELPALAAAGDWDAIAARVARAQADQARSEDRVRAVPVPAEAVRSVQAYEAALGHVAQAIAALGRYAEGHADAALTAADAELETFNASRKGPGV
jgi:hypothetical protein